MRHLYRVGQRVSYRPDFGSGPSTTVTIIDLGEKNNRPVYSLSNNRWCYEEAVISVVKKESVTVKSTRKELDLFKEFVCERLAEKDDEEFQSGIEDDTEEGYKFIKHCLDLFIQFRTEEFNDCPFPSAKKKG